jgi:hypothetical protein
MNGTTNTEQLYIYSALPFLRPTPPNSQVKFHVGWFMVNSLQDVFTNVTRGYILHCVCLFDGV